MIVQCPQCATRYQLDAGRLTGPKPLLKCSRCRHVFPARPSKPAPPPAPPSRETPPVVGDDSLTLPFEEASWKDEPERSPSDDFGAAEEETFTLEPETPPTAVTFDADETAPRPTQAAKAPAAEDAEPPPRSARRFRHQPSHLAPVFIFLVVIVSGYALLARALFASPALCDRLVGRLPFIGMAGDDRLLVRKVALSNVVGNYQRIKDGKAVFVVTGKALNTAPVAVYSVQIAGKLYDGAGQALDQKVIYCGNVISTKVLKDLTPREVSILQKLNPPKKFMIEPGESSTFVIVFMDPPSGAVEFSTQVVAAQRQA